MRTVTFGAPGTGKTTRLLIDLKQTLEHTPHERIAILTHCTAPTREILQRLGIPFETAQKEYRSWGTFHSVISRLLNLQEIGFLSDEDYIGFCDQHGFDYAKNRDEEHQPYSNHGKRGGNEIFAAFDKATNINPTRPPDALPTQLTLRRHKGAISLYYQDIRRLYHAWMDYKQDECIGRLDYTDILLHGLSRLGNHGALDAVFVDEFQDLSPLQYLVYQQMSREAEAVYIYGDDDQNIYEGFLGSRSEHLLAEREEATVRILDRSYRLPRTILTYLLAFIRQNHTRQDKNVQPVSEGGYLEQSSYNSLEELLALIPPTETAFFLTQAHFMADEISRQLTDLLIIHRRINRTGPWDGLFPYYADALVCLQRQTPINEYSLVTTLRNCHTRPLLPSGQKKYCEERAKELRQQLNNQVGLSQAWPPLPLTQNQVTPRYLQSLFGQLMWNQPDLPHRILTQLDTGEAQKRVLHQILQGRSFELEKPRIAVGTIHSSKGMEADNVFLCNLVTGSFIREAQESPELTRRVFYVGGSRARKRLVIFDNQELITAPNSPWEPILYTYPLPQIAA